MPVNAAETYRDGAGTASADRASVDTGPTDRAPVLVLGVGNELFTDEGLGCVAAGRLAALGLSGVDVLDGSTLGIALLPELADRHAVLILDAIISDGAPPGQYLELRGDQVPAFRQLTMSAHQIGVGEALAAAVLADRAPRELAALGLVPDVLTTGYGLSPVVAERMDTLVGHALRVLAGWGVEVPDHA